MKRILTWVRRFVMVYGILMISTFLMCLLFNPTSVLPVVSFFGRMFVFTLLAVLSMAVYYSKEELTPKAWWVRTILHLLVLEAVLLPLAHNWGYWHNGPDIVIYASFILLAKVFWHLIDYGLNVGTAEQINRRIRENRRERRKEVGEL